MPTKGLFCRISTASGASETKRLSTARPFVQGSLPQAEPVGSHRAGVHGTEPGYVGARPFQHGFWLGDQVTRDSCVQPAGLLLFPCQRLARLRLAAGARQRQHVTAPDVAL